MNTQKPHSQKFDISVYTLDSTILKYCGIQDKHSKFQPIPNVYPELHSDLSNLAQTWTIPTPAQDQRNNQHSLITYRTH